MYNAILTALLKKLYKDLYSITPQINKNRILGSSISNLVEGRTEKMELQKRENKYKRKRKMADLSPNRLITILNWSE